MNNWSDLAQLSLSENWLSFMEELTSESSDFLSDSKEPWTSRSWSFEGFLDISWGLSRLKSVTSRLSDGSETKTWDLSKSVDPIASEGSFSLDICSCWYKSIFRLCSSPRSLSLDWCSKSLSTGGTKLSMTERCKPSMFTFWTEGFTLKSRPTGLTNTESVKYSDPLIWTSSGEIASPTVKDLKCSRFVSGSNKFSDIRAE